MSANLEITFVDGVAQLLMMLFCVWATGHRNKLWWFENNNINNPITAAAIEAEWWLDRMQPRRVN